MKLQTFIGKRIKQLRLSNNMNQDMLAEILNTTKQSISRYENGDRKVDQDILFELSNVFNVSIDDFFPSDNEMIITPSSEYTYFPTAISAGSPFTVDGMTESSKISISDEVMGSYKNDRDIFFARINGDSMDKAIPDGSLIAIKPTETEALKNGDIVVYSSDGEYSVKHFYKTSASIIFKPNSTNIEHHEHHYSQGDEIKIYGKVVTYIVNV